MATLLLVTHRDDRFGARAFLVRTLLSHWEEAGHRVIVHAGSRDLPPADLAFLHLDCTEVPAAYKEAVAPYRRVLNGATGDVSKRAISRHLVTDAAAYAGPVIVKTNRNSGGYPEAMHAKIARDERGEETPPVRYMKDAYPIFPSACHVPPAVLRDPDLVVEKFLPEKDERGYYALVWPKRERRPTPSSRALEAFDPDVLLVDMFWLPLHHVLPRLRAEARPGASARVTAAFHTHGRTSSAG